jgi:hypothetical protein
MDVSVAGPEKVSRVARLVALQGGARGFEPKPATALPNGILWLVQSEPCKTHPRVVCHDNLAKRRQLLIHPTVMTTPVGMPHRYRLNRAIASVVIVLVALSTLQRLLRDFDQGGTAWRQADWLINSASGPVRRSVFGDFVIWLSDLLGCSPVVFVLSLQAVLCVLVLTTLWIALRRARWSAPLVLIAVSPVCLLFWFNDPIGTLRKELLFYAAMSLILLAPASRLALVSAAVVFAAAVVGHEGMVLALPVILIAFWQIRSAELAGAAPVVAALICTVAAVFAAAFAMLHVTVQDTGPICDVLLQRGAPEKICSGAFKYLSNSFTAQPGNVLYRSAPSDFGRYLGYAALGLVTFTVVWPRRRYKLRAAAAYLAAFALFLPLAFIAVDWGRCLSLASMSVLFLLLLRAGIRSGSENSTQTRRGVFWAVLILNGLWVVPHYITSTRPEAILLEFLGDVLKVWN